MTKPWTLTEPFRSCNEQPTILPSSRSRRCSIVKKVSCFNKEEPTINLHNNSSYEVSFWVIQEDKLATTRITQMISREMCGEVGKNKVELRGGSKEETEIIKDTIKKGYILTEDERVGEVGSSAQFPVDCKELRVLGFFREKSSNHPWKRFKNKVYSIGRGDKVFTLVALDRRLKRYHEHEEPSNGDTIHEECQDEHDCTVENGERSTNHDTPL